MAGAMAVIQVKLMATNGHLVLFQSQTVPAIDFCFYWWIPGAKFAEASWRSDLNAVNTIIWQCDLVYLDGLSKFS